jgi:hypothetical protein
VPAGDRRLARFARFAWSARCRAVLSIGALLGIGTATAAAQWTGGATASATFSTGSIDLRLGSAQVDSGPAETATLALADMVPGSSVTTALPIRNVGTYPFAYSMATVASGALASGLRLSVYANTTCAGSPTVVDNAALTAAAFAGRPLTGSAGATPAETLCFRVTLPADAAGTLQGATATATFTFTAATA